MSGDERSREEQTSIEIHQAVEQIKAAGRSKPRAGRDPVNQPMIRHWVDAMGDENPIYVDETAAQARPAIRASSPRRR